MASWFTRFLDHTQRRTTVGRTPLDEWSARRRDLFLTTHNTHSRQISMPPVGFEPTISAGEWPQTYALDRAATGTGDVVNRIVEWKRNLVAHGDARVEKWRGKRRMEWVASSLQLDSEQSIHCYYNRSRPTRTPRKPVLDWTDTPPI